MDGGGGRGARRGRDRGHPRARARERRRGAGAAVLRRPGRGRAPHRPRGAERLPTPGVPLRLHHHDLPHRRVGDDPAGRGGGGRLRGPGPPALRRRAGPGVRSGGGAQRAGLQRAGGGARGGQRDRRHAHRRAAPRLGPDGGPGGNRTAGDPLVPDHAGRLDGDRDRRLPGRPGHLGVRVLPRPGRPRPHDRPARPCGLHGHLAPGSLPALPAADPGAVPGRSSR